MASGPSTYDFAVIGGGILGLATAMTLLERAPGSSLVLLEKEDAWARHQTGRNSGVIHAGVYYTPGSAKAAMCLAGKESLARFATEHGVPFELCGKLIVATSPEQVDPLRSLYERARENGVPVELLSAAAGREIEPHVRMEAAIHSPTTGIIDFGAVSAAMARVAADRGADLRRNSPVVTAAWNGTLHIIATPTESIAARFLVSCAGLHSDRVAALSGATPEARIVPFRGEYYELVPERRSLINALVYPVPDPRLPFLGVHLTRMIDGGVHAGPNAVLAFSREGYRKRNISLRDMAATLTYGGFWKLAGRYWREGSAEMLRSFSRRRFVRSLQELVPDLTAADIVPADAGVRAQAVRPDGSMVDDFLFTDGPSSVHVTNAPSPAATASLEIASAIVDRVLHAAG